MAYDRMDRDQRKKINAGKIRSVKEKMVRVIEAKGPGITMKAACANAGVSTNTYNNWVKRSKEPDSNKIYKWFFEKMKAKDDAVCADLQKIRIEEAMKNRDPELCLKILQETERRSFNNNKKEIQVTGDENILKLVEEVKKLTPEQRQKQILLLTQNENGTTERTG